MVALGACGKKGEVHPPGPAPAGDVTIVQRNYKFIPDQLNLPVGRDVTIVIENQDKATAHNMHFTTLPGSPKSKLENGPVYQTLTVRFDKAGTYPFQCDPHTPAMSGTVVAA